MIERERDREGEGEGGGGDKHREILCEWQRRLFFKKLQQETELMKRRERAKPRGFNFYSYLSFTAEREKTKKKFKDSSYKLECHHLCGYVSKSLQYFCFLNL